MMMMLTIGYFVQSEARMVIPDSQRCVLTILALRGVWLACLCYATVRGTRDTSGSIPAWRLNVVTVQRYNARLASLYVRASVAKCRARNPAHEGSPSRRPGSLGVPRRMSLMRLVPFAGPPVRVRPLVVVKRDVVDQMNEWDMSEMSCRNVDHACYIRPDADVAFAVIYRSCQLASPRKTIDSTGVIDKNAIVVVDILSCCIRPLSDMVSVGSRRYRLAASAALVAVLTYLHRPRPQPSDRLLAAA
ncbi:uncharacterized protein C8Q71DRAFT_783670 [Rhodofomes roseus]|uniref:Uncharacterized protein n=1 Tax=Rhodofomes roseus TaxID=34475 RepID=A0ABQ8K2C8_9APHY|nr:uncharacterized protein C8Q71DRAFT_783670 [Rhodofomes roseus]KAH9830904.1 hypothetical protein C8Q71DRAFT_783670 [Rhodofomes roseus]